MKSRKNRSLLTALVVCLASLGSGTVLASAFTEAKEAVAYRQAAFQLVRENFAFMASMVRGERGYNAELFEERAQALYHLSHVPWDGFNHAGYSQSGDGDALPAIWENWDDFNERAQQFQQDAQALAEAATSHDMDEIRGAFMNTARNCKQCHDNYRAD